MNGMIRTRSSWTQEPRSLTLERYGSSCATHRKISLEYASFTNKFCDGDTVPGSMKRKYFQVRTGRRKSEKRLRAHMWWSFASHARPQRKQVSFKRRSRMLWMSQMSSLTGLSSSYPFGLRIAESPIGFRDGSGWTFLERRDQTCFSMLSGRAQRPLISTMTDIWNWPNKALHTNCRSGLGFGLSVGHFDTGRPDHFFAKAAVGELCRWTACHASPAPQRPHPHIPHCLLVFQFRVQ